MNQDSIEKKTLTTSEIYYIRMLLFGFSLEKIIDFFDSSKFHVDSLHHSIENKYETSNWSQIIRQCFENGYLYYSDYKSNVSSQKIADFVNENLVNYTHKEINKQNFFFVLKKDIRKLFRSIYIHNRLNYFYDNSSNKLNVEEETLIRNRFHKVKKINFKSKDNNVLVKADLIDIVVFNKLQLYNWMAVYRYAYQGGFLSSKTNYSDEKKVENICSKIIGNLKTEISLYAKKNFVYKELINAIVQMEFDEIFTKKHTLKLY
jgi:hypothetical protein